MDVSVGDGRDTGLFTKVVLGSLVLGRDRGYGAKCAAAANKPVNRSGGQRFFLSPRSLAAARLPWSLSAVKCVLNPNGDKNAARTREYDNRPKTRHDGATLGVTEVVAGLLAP